MKALIVRYLHVIRLFAQLSFVASVLIISCIAFLPSYDTLPECASLSDVLNHFIAFFVLSFFLDLGFSINRLSMIYILTAYGFFIEIVQHFLPNRNFDLMDIVVDVSGIFIYLLFTI